MPCVCPTDQPAGEEELRRTSRNEGAKEDDSLRDEESTLEATNKRSKLSRIVATEWLNAHQATMLEEKG
ncbi:hypothetical protein HUJ04_008589 [Dendroctonus ponderosae]|nr:hypothetical protein HUJ04_008589 [Dendroctonus ponderosae]KAH1008491.1 hypothetical protein HUJ05_009041 [Dendroctonus ponderosae]